MTTRIAALLWLIASVFAGTNAAAAGADSVVQRSWLMMVTTQNTDPTKEAEFNAWYDDVDIPDVLKVPGYMRARRGLEQRVPGFSSPEAEQRPINYVALYDIESRAIDKTIIDMLMASWGMEKSHHSTDLLKVTERVYFHQYSPAYRTTPGRSSEMNRYIYMTRFDCCTDAGARKRFDHWYTKTYLPAVLASARVASATRYELYRVLMDRPLAMPNFLNVYEIEAASAEQAMQNMRNALERVSDADPMKGTIAGASPSIFRKISDVARPASR